MTHALNRFIRKVQPGLAVWGGGGGGDYYVTKQPWLYFPTTC